MLGEPSWSTTARLFLARCGGPSGWEAAVGVGSSGWETAVDRRGGNRRVSARRAAGVGTLVGIGVGIGASRGVAQRGVLVRWWAGRPASPQTVEIKQWYRRRFWAAPTPIRAVKGMRGATKARWGFVVPSRREGDLWCHQGGRWGFVVAPRRAMGIRGGTKARIGVGAVQNRRTGLGDNRDVAGDAGQPAHQRPETPRCARYHPRPHRTPMIPRPPPIPTRLRPRHAPIPTPMHTACRRFAPDALRGSSRMVFVRMLLCGCVVR
jgi:hypothetical protein